MTPNQFREFLDVSTPGQKAQRRAFLVNQGIDVFGGPKAGAVAASADFQRVFNAVEGVHGRGDAALAAFAKATGFEPLSRNTKLANFFEYSAGRGLGVKIEIVPNPKP